VENISSQRSFTGAIVHIARPDASPMAEEQLRESVFSSTPNTPIQAGVGTRNVRERMYEKTANGRTSLREVLLILTWMHLRHDHPASISSSLLRTAQALLFISLVHHALILSRLLRRFPPPHVPTTLLSPPSPSILPSISSTSFLLRGHIRDGSESGVLGNCGGLGRTSRDPDGRWRWVTTMQSGRIVA